MVGKVNIKQLTQKQILSMTFGMSQQIVLYLSIVFALQRFDREFFSKKVIVMSIGLIRIVESLIYMTHQEFSFQLKLQIDVLLNSDLFHRYSMFVGNNPMLFDSVSDIIYD